MAKTKKQIEYILNLPEDRLKIYLQKVTQDEAKEILVEVESYDGDKNTNSVKSEIYNFLQIEPEIDTSKFNPLTADDLIAILGQTIKKDETNKLLTFLVELSVFAGDNQLNLSFNAPSSTGKSFIPLEIAKYFPEKNVIEVGYCSPTAFFHDYGIFDKELGGYVVDLSKKIMIFLDQPHDYLLQHLRPILSHDKKEIHLKITDKSQKAGLRTKNITIIGFPVVIFCTAGLRIDEQEATRFLLLSPEINQEKIREAIHEKIRKEVDPVAYKNKLEADPQRQMLIERILAIKQAGIQNIRIPTEKTVEDKFFEKAKVFKPRHQRDIGKIISLIKTFALLNLWFRDKNEEDIIANEKDVEDAFTLWNSISESQELNLPPYVFNFFYDVIVPAYNKKNSVNEGVIKLGVTRQEIIKSHYEVFGRFIDDVKLRMEIIPMLETAGLISQENDEKDKRVKLIYPTIANTISSSLNNSVEGGGVA